MGKEKTTNTTDSKQSQTVAASPQETALNQLQLDEYKASSGQRQAVGSAGLNLSQLLLEGRQLPGYLQGLPAGISPEVTQGIVDQSLRDVNTQMAFSGAGTFMESGASQAAGVRAAGDIRNQSAQFNLGNLQQLINLAVGGQAVPLGYQNDLGGNLGQRLAGLRSVSQQGTSNQINRNPFISGKDVMTGVGTAVGAFGAFCWISAEVLDEPMDGVNVSNVRRLILESCPSWFINFYRTHGQSMARFIHKNPILKKLLKPLFLWVSRKGIK